MAPLSLQVPVLLLLLQLSAAAAVSSSGYYSFPVFDGKSTTDGVAVATNSSMLAPATFLFDAQLFPEFNESDGFVLLSRSVVLWRVGADDGAREEASFNTTFTVDVQGSSSDAVSFVVLLDSFPPLNSKNEKHKHGPRRGSVVLVSSVPNATNGIAAVEVGTVSSYGNHLQPGVGLNITITPNRSSVRVRIDYDAAAHRLSVYVDDGVNNNNNTALLDAPLDLAGRQPTQAALMGFFSATVRDIVVGVRGWELTVNGLQDDVGDGPRRQRDEQSTSPSSSWLVILLAVLGSVAVAAAVVVSVMVYQVVSRRRAVDMEVQQCYRDYFARMAQGNGERTVE